MPLGLCWSLAEQPWAFVFDLCKALLRKEARRTTDMMTLPDSAVKIIEDIHNAKTRAPRLVGGWRTASVKPARFCRKTC